MRPSYLVTLERCQVSAKVDIAHPEASVPNHGVKGSKDLIGNVLKDQNLAHTTLLKKYYSGQDLRLGISLHAWSLCASCWPSWFDPSYVPRRSSPLLSNAL